MNVTLSRKLNTVLETRTDNPELLAALHALSSYYGQNTAANRRSLGADVESRGLKINQDFLKAFEKANEALAQVEKDVQSLSECCNDVTNRLQKTRSATQDLLSTTVRLGDDHKKVQAQSFLVGAFLERFQPSAEELYALQHGPIDTPFFAALRRVQEIHADCKTLLRTYYHKAGVEIMDGMAVYQDQAYQRVYRWLQNECRDQLEADVVDVSSLLRHAFTALRYNPHLFRTCLEEVSNTRRGALIKRFIGALTRGGRNGMPRPIELHAHDPLRYAGDMLAWLHQAVASERELMTVLFTPSNMHLNAAALALVPNTAPRDEVISRHGVFPDMSSDIIRILDHIFEGVCRTFKARADQIVQALPTAVVSWKLANLFDFYTQTISGLLGPEAALTHTFLQCKEAALKVFFSQLKAQSDRLMRFPPRPNTDLSPPQATGETLKILTEIATSFKGSLVPEADRETAFAPVLNAMLDPLLQLCENVADGLDHSDTAVFIINVLSSIRTALMEFAFCSPRVHTVTAQIQDLMKHLVQEQTFLILERCGLMEKLQALQSAPPDKPLSSAPGMDAQSLTESLRAFYASLFALGALVIPQCDRLLDQRLRVTARQGVAQSVAATHSALYSAIMDPRNGYQDPASILLHSPEQVRTLLNVD